MNNLKLAEGDGGVFNSTSTHADVFAQGMQGIVRLGQRMHPEIRVPHNKAFRRLFRFGYVDYKGKAYEK